MKKTTSNPNTKKTPNLRLFGFSISLVFLSAFLLTACHVQFSMNAASIDYSVIRTISIQDFPNRATLVYGPLESRFNEALRDLFSRQTRLQQIPRNGDLQIEGEITDYTLTQMSVGADAFARQTRLTVTVRVRFTNTRDSSQDFETTFSASQTFTQMLSEVQGQLVDEIVRELTETIFNRSVANW